MLLRTDLNKITESNHDAIKLCTVMSQLQDQLTETSSASDVEMKAAEAVVATTASRKNKLINLQYLNLRKV